MKGERKTEREWEGKNVTSDQSFVAKSTINHTYFFLRVEAKDFNQASKTSIFPFIQNWRKIQKATNRLKIDLVAVFRLFKAADIFFAS